jgi:hypothetical protein
MMATGTEKVHRTDLPEITGPKLAMSDGYSTESDSGLLVVSARWDRVKNLGKGREAQNAEHD